MGNAIAQGFLLALGLILPLGVQNTFVFLQGTRQRRWVSGLPVVTAAAACDTLLIAAAVSGVSLVVLTVDWFETALTWLGVAFLLYLGWATWRADPGEDAGTPAEHLPVARQIRYAVSVSLLNPHAILDTVGVIGTASLQYGRVADRLAFAATAAAVSWIWFLGLMTAGFALGAAGLTPRLRRLLNRTSALIMWAVAVQLLARLHGA